MEKINDIEASNNKLKYAIMGLSDAYDDLNSCIKNFNLFPKRRQEVFLLNSSPNSLNNAKGGSASTLARKYSYEYNTYASKFNSLAIHSLNANYQISQILTSGNVVENYCRKPNEIRNTVRLISGLSSKDNAVIDLVFDSWRGHILTAIEKIGFAKTALDCIEISNESFNMADVASEVAKIKTQLYNLDALFQETGTTGDRNKNLKKITVTEIEF